MLQIKRRIAEWMRIGVPDVDHLDMRTYREVLRALSVENEIMTDEAKREKGE